MDFHYRINHLIPGRIRLTIPALEKVSEQSLIQRMLLSIDGIRNVRLIPIIQSAVIEYDTSVLTYEQVIEHTGLLCNHAQVDYRFLGRRIKKDTKHYLIRSGISGVLLLLAFLRKNLKMGPDIFDYLALMATSYTVLTHGDGEDKLNHPDVITGIISILSMGERNILHVAVITWFVNLLEVFNEWRRKPKFIG